jgi:uncharacterized surface protein with fasciclin (FAS1) repeats
MPPPSRTTILSALADIPEASVFYSVVSLNPIIAPMLGPLLNNPSTKVTLFVPTDLAVNSVPPAVFGFLTAPENRFFLYATLVYHVVTQGGPYKYSEGVQAVMASGQAVTLPSGFVINNGANPYPLIFNLNS